MRVALGLGAIQLAVTLAGMAYVHQGIGGVVLMVVLGVALELNLDCALPVAFGGSGVRTGLTAGHYLGGVMAGTEAALLLVPGSG